MSIDKLNWKILEELQKNARISFSEIGRKVGLTSPAVAERVKKMEDSGVINSYKVNISPQKTGYQLRAVITLRAFTGRLKAFLETVKTFKEVINCYRITGNENIIMEVILHDQDHLEKLIDKLITYGETRYQYVTTIGHLTDRLSKNCEKLEYVNSNGREFVKLLKKEINKFRKLQHIWKLTL